MLHPFLILAVAGIWMTAPHDPPGSDTRMRRDHAERLVVDHYQDHRRTGQDRLPIPAMDTASVRFDPGMGAVTVHCLGGHRCAEMESFRSAITKRSSRYAIPVPADDPTGERTMARLRELLTAPPAGADPGTDVTMPASGRNTLP